METSSETNNSYAFFRNGLKTSRLTKQDKARKSFEKTIAEAEGIVLRTSRGYFAR